MLVWSNTSCFLTGFVESGSLRLPKLSPLVSDKTIGRSLSHIVFEDVEEEVPTGRVEGSFWKVSRDWKERLRSEDSQRFRTVNVRGTQ